MAGAPFVTPYHQAFAQAVTSAADNAHQSTDDEIVLESTFDLKTYLRENPLAPPDTSSPRASLESFILLMDQASTVWREVRTAFHDSNERLLSDADELKLQQVRALLDKASGVFDLSGIPETARQRASLEISLQFQEILDRIYLPKMADVPGSAAGSFLNSMAIAQLPERWTIPGTDLVFERTRVPGAGSRFLMTRESVALIPEDYELIKAFAPREDIGDDLYAYYIYTPGNLVAPKWYDLIRAGPAWLGNHIFSQAYWQWLALFLLTIVAISLPVVLSRWDRMRAVSVLEFRRRLRSLQLPILIIGTILVYRYLIEEQVNITGSTMVAVGTVSTALVWTCLGWLVYRFIDLASVWIIRNPVGTGQPMDSSLLLTAFRLFGLVAGLIVTGYGATRIGIPVYGVIAGLGVGGLAVALAAQPTLENLIGGIILYADKMVRVGEFCEFDDLSGTVEAIGIRSTRIRALDRTMITISNADLAKRKIINYSRRDEYFLRHKLGLRYGTTEVQMAQLIEEIRSYLEQHEMVAEAPLRVRFVGMGSYTLDVEIYAYIKTADRNMFLEIQEKILLKAMEIVRDCGADFALPSSTNYLAQDSEKAPVWPLAPQDLLDSTATDAPKTFG
ncbi:mechanosensitive ion channel family protein [Roseibium algae]|uniref:Mechanosensitive ion channel family protein n=1 Tax=Roseibium algae TaxID=3123038 RepID=A0ABU8TP94_9HYPH